MLNISPKSFISSDLIGNKIANKIKITSPQNILDIVESETEIPKERYIFPGKKRANYWPVKINIII